MGLSIHYDFEYHQDYPTKIINTLRHKALTLPFENVSELGHLVGSECDYVKVSRENEWLWLLIQATETIEDKEKREYSYCVTPIEVIAFRTWPGEGCEPANFGLCRFPSKIEIDNDRSIETGLGTGWHWSSFFKTQYVMQSGIEHFLKCHLMVIKMLDFAKELGILKRVSDDGEYWKKRSVEELVKEVGEWDAFIAAQVGSLLDKTPEGGHVEAEILKRPDFEHLETEGRKLYPQLFKKEN